MGVINGPARVSENAKELATVCVLCSHNCAMRVDVENNAIVKVRADDSSPITRGYSCNKGYRIAHYVNHKQRVEYPMKRRADGSFERISWDRAISEIAAKLKGVLAKHPGRSLAIAGIGGQGNHMDGPYAIPFLFGAGSNIVFNSLAQEKTQHALVDRWMFNGPNDTYLHGDAEHAEYLLMLGTNPVVSNRGVRATETIKQLRSDEGRTLVVVDPRRTETARRASRHLRVKPGMDIFLMLGLCAHIVREGLVDEAFVSTRVRDFEKLRKTLREIDPAVMAARCGLDLSEIAEVAEGFARAGSAAVFADLGVEQIPYSTLMSWLMRVLCVITGNLGNHGGQTFLPMFSPKMPRLKMTLPRALESDIEAIDMWFPFGMFSPNLIPEEILSENPARIRALIVEGANPLVSFADSHRLREAFEKLDLLVVIDPAFTETAQVADYVLPTPVGYEKWEYSGFPKTYPEISAQVRPPVVRGPAEALPESEIYYRLARAMGLVEPAPRVLHALAKRARNPLVAPLYLGTLMTLAGVRSALSRNLQQSVARVVFWLYETLGPTLPAPQLAITWMMALGFGATRKDEIARIYPQVARMRNPFAIGEFLFQQILDHPEGVILARVNPDTNLEDNIGYKDGRIRSLPPQMEEELGIALADTFPAHAEYPFIMDGGMRTIWNANTIQRDPAWRKGRGPFCQVLLHPDDARAIGVATGDPVRVETSRGAAEAPALVDESTLPGHIHVPNGFGLEYPDVSGTLVRDGIRVNELTDAAVRDRFTGCPHHKHIRCKVSAVGAAQAEPAA